MKKIPFRKIFRPFFRLQWRLTLSYMLITIGVLFALLLVAIYLSSQMMYDIPNMTALMAEALASSNTDLAPSLETTPADTATLKKWIDKTLSGGSLEISSSNEDGISSSLSFSSVVSNSAILCILDAQGNVIVSNHDDLLPVGKPFPENLSQNASVIIQNALTGSAETKDLHSRVNQQSIAAATIHSQTDQRLLGVVIIVLNRPNQLELLSISLLSVLPSMMVVTIFAGVIGTLFGWMTARGLSHRLKRATRATNAWGRGDFSVRIEDKVQDEIGVLSGDLNRMANDLRALMETRQELAAMEERNRLARDLHDSVKQQVFATSMNLAAAQSLWEKNPTEARKRLEMALGLSKQSQQELTTLIQTLRPIQLEKVGLTQALREIIQTWERQNSISTTIEIGENIHLTREVEQELFRVVQEALANIARHSGATAVQIRLTVSGNQEAFLSICDNGHGFDLHSPQRGLGLRSMQERIQSLGGKFNIESQSGGTCIEARVPSAETAIS